MKIPNTTFTGRILAMLTALTLIGTAQAEPKTVQEALAIAMENETIKGGGEKMKLYSVNATIDAKRKYYSFSFWDGSENTHSVSVDQNGKARYFAREKSKFMRVFDDLDFSKLPAPKDVFIEDVAGKSKGYLSALDFKPFEGGKVMMTYSLRSEFRQKDKPKHVWNVTMPIADGKRGKIVVFSNGELEGILNTTMYGS